MASPRGLNKTQRGIVRAMVLAEEDGERIRDAIEDMVRREEWDYKKNSELCAWLALNGYAGTARFLEEYINGEW